jgi:3-methyladenine DNA glycosylase Tag
MLGLHDVLLRYRLGSPGGRRWPAWRDGSRETAGIEKSDSKDVIVWRVERETDAANPYRYRVLWTSDNSSPAASSSAGPRTQDFARTAAAAIVRRFAGRRRGDPRRQGLTMVDTPAAPVHPLEDGRTRCSWVAGRPEHNVFHDAEFGMIPDTDDLARERVFLTCLRRDMPLVDALDQRDAMWAAFKGYDPKTLETLDDAWVAETAARGGVLADRARLAWMRDVGHAVAATMKETKDFREYLLAVRFLPAEEQFADMTARFPGFTKVDAANLMEIAGTVEGLPHERDCWRA